MLPLPPLLCLTLTLCVLGSVAQADDCHPTCDGVDPGTLFSDPTDCTKYYVCLPDGSLYSQTCEKGQEFDNDSKVCVDEGTITCIECEPSCHYTCPGDDTTIAFRADLGSCSVFYLCPYNGGSESTQSCSGDTPNFDGMSCTADAAQCCDPCITYCFEEGDVIPDPTDCKSFYVCRAVGQPSENSIHCSEGNFDPGTKLCSTTAPCNEPCHGVIGNNTTTTVPGETADCYDTWLCEHTGYFPACTNRCSPRYFRCDLFDEGSYAELHLCSSDTLLNPDDVMCVPPLKCPYPPEE